MRHTVSIFKCSGKDAWTVIINGTGMSFESEKEAFLYLRNEIAIMESAVNSAIETYLSNKWNT